MPVVNTLDDLRAELHKVFAEDRVNVEYVKELMESYKSKPADWKKYALWDRYRYTRNMVDEGNGKFNLMMLCWGPSQTSTIHDHADAHCFMKQLMGQLQEVRFEWPEEKPVVEGIEGNEGLEYEDDTGMVEKSSDVLKLNQVLYINDDQGLHRVENASHSEGAVSLHLYVPPFDECSIFDERTSRRTKCKVTFWSKDGKKCHPGQ